MHIPFDIRRILVSGVILASVACGDDKSSPKCEEGEECDAGNGGNADCNDGKQNGDESDVDCGGACGACEEGQQCNDDDDCGPSLGCSTQNNQCAQGAEPGFTLSNPGGVVPVIVTATSTATPGSSGAAIVTTRYDWGDGSGFVEGDSHKYRQGGTFTVRQQVVDANGVTITQEEGQTVTLEGFDAVRFSASDKHERVFLNETRYEAGVDYDTANAHGARSEGTIAPRSGVFYFEAESLVPSTDDDFSSIGVGTADHPLDQFVGLPDAPGTMVRQSFGVYGLGSIPHSGGTCTGPGAALPDSRVLFDRTIKQFGFVIDYRAANPTIYVLLKEGESLVMKRSCSLMTGAPLHVVFAGRRSTLGPQVRINTGADVTNHPFVFPAEQVKAALTAAEAGPVADAIEFGFGKTRTPMENKAPVLTTSADMTAALNAPVMLTASASDEEDGDLTEKIVWTNISTSFFEREMNMGTGGSFSFTPTRIGRYPIEVKVMDLDETVTVKTIMVTVSGMVEQNRAAMVRLVAPECPEEDPCGTVSANGLTFTRRGGVKNGAKANQGNNSQFWYFEAHRNGPAANIGAGLITGEGSLTPYSTEDVPYSMSVSMETGIWRNLNSVHGYDTTGIDHFGIAVDYRGMHPKVYVFVGTAATPATARLEHTMELTEVWGPVYPMLYGTMGGSTPAAMMSTATINFGATPMVFTNVPALLTGAGVDPAGLALRWGNP